MRDIKCEAYQEVSASTLLLSFGTKPNPLCYASTKPNPLAQLHRISTQIGNNIVQDIELSVRSTVRSIPSHAMQVTSALLSFVSKTKLTLCASAGKLPVSSSFASKTKPTLHYLVQAHQHIIIIIIINSKFKYKFWHKTRPTLQNQHPLCLKLVQHWCKTIST